jgi:hypothetical protein
MDNKDKGLVHEPEAHPLRPFEERGAQSDHGGFDPPGPGMTTEKPVPSTPGKPVEELVTDGRAKNKPISKPDSRDLQDSNEN